MARDLTKGKPLKGILLFSLPIMAPTRYIPRIVPTRFCGKS